MAGCAACVIVVAIVWILYSELHPKMYLLGCGSESQYENFFLFFNTREYCESMYFNEEKGEVHVSANGRQRRNWIKEADEIINTFRNHDMSLIPLDMVVSPDRKVIRLSMTYENDLLALWLVLRGVEIYQVFSGNSDWEVDIFIYDRNTDDLIYQCRFPEEGVALTPDMFRE